MRVALHRWTPLNVRAGSLLIAALLAGSGLTAVAAPAAAADAETAFVPVADTWVDAAKPASTHGSSSRMVVDGSPQRVSYVRFDLAALAGRTVTGVRLRLFQTDASRLGGLVHGVSSQEWSESVSWDTRPAVDGPLLATFGAVTRGSWYEVSVDAAAVGAGLVSFALTSSSSDGAYWATRETSTPPQLVVAHAPGAAGDLTNVAAADTGSSEPTYYAGGKRLAVTAGGRTLAVHGRHRQGIDLRWRDPGGTWQSASTGDTDTGALLAGTGTGDWSASVVVAADAGGAQHAWVVWSGTTTGRGRTLQLRRLSGLDAPGGPHVGPLVTLDPTVGSYKPDLAIERSPDGTSRIAVVYSRRSESGFYEITVGWLDDLQTPTPLLVDRAVLNQSTSSSRYGSLVETTSGLTVVARASSSRLVAYRHDPAGGPLAWTRAASGPVLPAGAFPVGVPLADGSLLVAVETALNPPVTGVYLLPAGQSTMTEVLSQPGLAQPTVASDGTRAWLVGVRAVDGALVSRAGSPGEGWTDVEREEVPSAVAGPMSRPSALRAVGGQLVLLAEGTGISDETSSVWSFARPL